LSPADFILPLFIRSGEGIKKPINSMPGHFQYSIDEMEHVLQEVKNLGIPGVILFGIPDKKDAKATGAYADKGIIQHAIKEAKRDAPGLIVMADLCFCEYTDHGHCGIIKKSKSGFELDNDATLEIIAKTAVSQAKAGADVIAPSGMIDGQIAVIRRSLDKAGFKDTAILAYAAKYSSAFYGPFREAAESPPQFGDRCSYQMDPANASEAIREVAMDIEEGADMVMVKPGLPYLDVLKEVKDTFGMPTAAYSVSGEYSMIRAGIERGWLDQKKTVLESLTCIKRAGADFILTYEALNAARWIREMQNASL
jgi:porphobilinogen synthase